MPLMKLQFKPGVNRETTGYANEGGWLDIDKVRFRQGYPEKIGGWQKFSTAALLGTTRIIFPWIALNGNQFIGFGTNLKYFVYGAGSYLDITPIRRTTSAGAVTFSVGRGTLTAQMNLVRVTIPVGAAAAATFSPTGGLVQIDDEQMTYTGINLGVLTGVTRGVNGTTVALHLVGAEVKCATVVVTDTANGAYQTDFVTFAGASGLGGTITADVLNQEYQIDSIIDGNRYTITPRVVSSVASITTPTGLAPTPVFGSLADTGNGGAGTVGAYQITTGLNTSIEGGGWGAGPWSRGGWGSGTTTTIVGAQLRLWSSDNYGENLLYNVRDGGIYYWERTNIGGRGVSLRDIPGSRAAPAVAKQIMVSDNDRHVIAFGCDDEFTPGVMDPLLIRFSSQEDITDWRTLETNTAGSLRIGSGSTIICAVETKQQTLVFTDTSLHAMQYLGPPFTFGINMLSSGISIAGPNATVNIDDAVYWMGQGEFYVYNGVVSQLPCDVKDYVFSDININQSPKIVCGGNPNFGEVWWFYPSANSQENDRYVVYNYQQQVWYYGTLSRTAWTHRNSGIYPLATGTDNYAYLHELGTDDGSANPPVGINAYIQSSGQDLGEGDQFAFLSRIIPDVTFRNSTGEAPTVTMTIKMSDFPGEDFTQENSRGVIRTAEVPVEQFTNQVYVRLRGRSFAFRVQSTGAGVAWRVGAPRVDARTDGRR